MRISAKGQYALAAIIEIAKHTQAGKLISAADIATILGISKLSLEQTILLLKKGDVIVSIKGAKGGYKLAREPQSISVFDILMQVENSLIEKMDNTVLHQIPATESALQESVFKKLDHFIERCLAGISLQQLLNEEEQERNNQSFMINL